MHVEFPGQAFGNTLGAKRKLEEMERQAEQAGDESRVTNCKRLRTTGSFLKDPLTPNRMLAQSIISVAPGKMFSTVFAAEHEATESTR